MTLSVVTAASAQLLLPNLAERVWEEQPDPFAEVVVVVPSAGMRQYVIEELLRHSPGPSSRILANVRFMHPREFDNWVVGGHRRERDDPWDPSHVRWELLDVLRSDPAAAPRFAEAVRPLAYADRLARLFDRYGVHRPEMLADWNACRESGDEPELVDDKYHWQFALWCALRSRLGVSPAERSLVPLGPRVSGRSESHITLFGFQTMSTTRVSLLEAIADFDDVKVLAVQPFECGGLTASFHTTPARRSVVDLRNRANDLARWWGRAALESGLMLSRLGSDFGRVKRTAVDSLLGRIQRDVESDVQPARRAVGEARTDGSLQVHLCHGATRQVEVARDAILHLLRSDGSLSLRDVLVLCTDLEAFGPLIEPIFGSLGVKAVVGDPIASTRSQTDLALELTMACTSGRCTARNLLDLAALEPVARRFQLTSEDLAAVDGVLSALDVTWGLNDSDRRSAGFDDGYAVGTLRDAIDRALAGILMSASGEEVAAGGIVPHPIGDLGVGVAVAKLDALLASLETLASMQRDKPSLTIGEWADVTRVLATDLLHIVDVDPDADEALTRLALRLTDVGRRLPHLVLGRSEYATLLAETVHAEVERSNQWTDAIRVGSFHRLGGVPARVVVVIGLDADRLSKHGSDGDDLVDGDPHVGDVDARSEERLVLLGSLMSAESAFVVVADGSSVTTNEEVELAQALTELIGVVAGYVDTVVNSSRPLVVRHPRQPFDPVNFGGPLRGGASNLGEFVDGPWSFDRRTLVIATPGRSPRGQSWDGRILLPHEATSPSMDAPSLTIDDLRRAISRPVEVFVRRRLGAREPGDTEEGDALIGLWPGPVDAANLGREALDAAQRGVDLREWRLSRDLRGGMPHGRLGDVYLEELGPEIGAMLEAAGLTGGAPDVVRRMVEIEVDGADIVDVVEVIGDRIVDIGYSRAHPESRVASLLRIAALTICEPATDWRATVVRRADKTGKPKGSKAAVENFRINGASPDERIETARRVLAFAVDMRARAMRGVVPMFRRSSWSIVGGSASMAASDLDRDLSAAPERLVFGGADLAWFESQEASELDDGLPAAHFPARRYALALDEWWRLSARVEPKSSDSESKSRTRQRKKTAS
jgi:exodeoxyribonuclease V gamma subunit